jgi:hypothetical protein
LEVSGLSKSEVMRLRCIMRGALDYTRMFALYADYKNLESEVVELRRELEEQRKSSKSQKTV